MNSDSEEFPAPAIQAFHLVNFTEKEENYESY